MGFPSPATDYTEQRLTVNSICNVGPNTRLFEHSGGGTELATLRGKSLITEDGEAIEGGALDDVTVIGVVTFTISDVRQDNSVV